MKVLFTIIIAVFGYALYAQTPAEQEPLPQFYYQIFLQDTLESIQDVIYTDDSTHIEYQLSPDGTAIYLLNYDGKRTIRATVVYKGGTSGEMTKPHCHINGLEHL